MKRNLVFSLAVLTLVFLEPALTHPILAQSPLRAYSPQRYPPEVEKRIKEVEINLGGQILIRDQRRSSLLERMIHYKIRGLSIAVVHDYQIEWARAYGWADSAEQRPTTTQTLFQAASISKSLNAVGLLKLAQDGKLDLYTDINQYLVRWKFPYGSLSKDKKITVANLLSHTAGLTIHGFPGYARGDSLPTLVEVLDGKRPANTNAVRSAFEPGLRSEYSGGGTVISQVILEDLTHEAYDRYMWENVLQPMGMTASSYTQPPAAGTRSLLATAYHADGSEVRGKYHVYPEDAPAGLWTNPTDLCKYIIETQLSYAGKSSKVLTQEYTRLRLTPYIDASAALGVFIDKKGGDRYFQHGGANEGFRCQYFGSLEGGNGVVVMVNSDNGGILMELINSVAYVYGWKDFYQPTLKAMASLTPSQLKSFEGKYKYRGPQDLSLRVEAKDDHLVIRQLWDGQEMEFYPESDSAFFSKEMVIPLAFNRNAGGAVVSASVSGRDFFDRVPD